MTLGRADHRIETQVAEYLQTNGYRLIEQHFLCPSGALDLVVQSKSDNVLVFVEVCWRREPEKTEGLPYIRPSKREQWCTAAQQFLKWRPWTSKCRHRFDLIVVSGPPETQLKITWYKNLFSNTAILQS